MKQVAQVYDTGSREPSICPKDFFKDHLSLVLQHVNNTLTDIDNIIQTKI